MITDLDIREMISYLGIEEVQVIFDQLDYAIDNYLEDKQLSTAQELRGMLQDEMIDRHPDPEDA